MKIWVCRHCGCEIKDHSKAWSRSGYHWCSVICMRQDRPGTEQSPLPPIMRKKR